LARRVRIGETTLARFERGQPVSAWSVAMIRAAFEAQHIQFIDDGLLAGGVIRSRIRFLDAGALTSRNGGRQWREG
jgi:hypothetical protein